MMIAFMVPGLPVAQPRQRGRVMMIGGKPIVQNFTPKTAPVQDFKATVRLMASQAYKGAPLTGPVKLTCTLIFPRPKALVWKSRPMPRVPKTTKPDWDNLGKSISDALTGILWIDDAQICHSVVMKFIAAGDEQARAEVVVEQIQL